MASRGPDSGLWTRAEIGAARALTVRQPWAWAIIYGGKDVENRRWRPTYRGLLLIHAAKDADPDGAAAGRLIWTMADPEGFGQPRAAWQAREAIIGAVFLSDVRTDSPSRWAADGSYHWELELPAPVDPAVSCPGRPGLWVPPAAAADRLADLL